MANDKNKNNLNEDEVLDHLIKESRPKRSGKYIKLSEDAILNYVMGTASESEKTKILESMALSSQFRREILDMVKEASALEKPEVHAKLERMKTEQLKKAPKLAELIKKYEKPKVQKPSIINAVIAFFGNLVSYKNWKSLTPGIVTAALVIIIITALIKPEESEVWKISLEPLKQVEQAPYTLFGKSIFIPLLAVIAGIVSILALATAARKLSAIKFSSLFINWRSYAPAVPMVALVLLVTIPLMTQTVNNLSPTIAGIEPSRLISNATRSTATVKTYETPQDAALAEFRFLVKYENRDFQLNPVIARTKPDSTLQPIEIKIMDSSRVLIEKFNLYIPNGLASNKEETMIWMFTLPSRDIYSLPLTDNTATIILTSEMGAKGCITITYFANSGYKANEGYTFIIK